MKVLNYILGVAFFKLAHEWNEKKYVWMNEEDYVFPKVDSLVEVPYV